MICTLNIILSPFVYVSSARRRHIRKKKLKLNGNTDLFNPSLLLLPSVPPMTFLDV